VLAVPVAAWVGSFRIAAVLSAIIVLEIGVLAADHAQCPPANIAEKFTANRSPDFDIYLPVERAGYNKVVLEGSSS
jgi:hypothetical protein